MPAILNLTILQTKQEDNYTPLLNPANSNQSKNLRTNIDWYINLPYDRNNRCREMPLFLPTFKFGREMKADMLPTIRTFRVLAVISCETFGHDCRSRPMAYYQSFQGDGHLVELV